jgi:hypothetical protein
MVQQSTTEPDAEAVHTESDKSTRSEISRVMAEMGRKGGKIGGKRRLKTMSRKERVKIATKAAKSRWKKAKRH